MNSIVPLWNIVLANSGRASLLIVCVLLLRWLGRGKLPARVFPWLWLLVAVRLLFPAAPSSSLSVYNLFISSPEPSTQTAPVWMVRKAPVRESKDEPATRLSTAQVPDTAAEGTSSTPWPLVPILWLAGVSLQIALLGWSAYRMRSALRNAAPVTDPYLLDTLRECAESVGLRRRVILVESAEISGPAVIGLWRPRLLLPRGLSEHLSTQELRFVLTHECAHLRRHDLPAMWLLLAARIVHWFNPLVWLAIHQSRVDAEFACDETVLRHAEDAEAPAAYGSALLRLAELVPWHPLSHPAAGILQRRTTLGARIATIGQYSPGAAWRTAAAFLLVLGVAVVFGADESRAPASTVTSPLAPTEKQTSELPEWARGLTVTRLSLPAISTTAPGQVELQTSDGRTFVPNIGAAVNDDPWMETLGQESDGTRWMVGLRKGADQATLIIPEEVVAQMGQMRGDPMQIEVSSRFIETTDTAIRRYKSGNRAAEALRAAIRNGPDQQILDATSADEMEQTLGAIGAQLTAPRVTTKSKQLAVIEVIREFRYPIKYDWDEKHQVWTPLEFETRNTGITLEVEPTLDGDGIIQMHLIAQAVELLGTRDPVSKKGYPVERKGPRTLNPMQVPGAFKIVLPGVKRPPLQPVFSTRKRESDVTIAPGQSVLFTTLPETEDVHPLNSPAKTRRLLAIISARILQPPPRRGPITRGPTKDRSEVSGSAVQDPSLSQAAPPAPDKAIVRASDKPGFVRSPYDPEAGLVDVRGFPPGASIKCPYTGKLFLLP